MKKLLTVLLSGAMLMSLTACGDKANEAASDEAAATTAQAEETTTQAATTTTKSAMSGIIDNDYDFSFADDEAVSADEYESSFDLDTDPIEFPDIEWYDPDSIPEPEFNFDLEEVDFDFSSIEPYEVQEYFGDTLNLEDHEDIDMEELEVIAAQKASLLSDLSAGFEAAGIDVTMDEVTGEIAFDSGILFGGDSAALSDDGKAFLKEFMAVYSDVVSKEQYDELVDTVLIEGHTAPLATSTYESGLPLSEERAETVMNYCLSDEVAISEDLADKLEAVGMSNSDPIYDADGNVDMEASRRVTVRFLIEPD